MSGGDLEEFEEKYERFPLIRWFFLSVGYAVAALSVVYRAVSGCFFDWRWIGRCLVAQDAGADFVQVVRQYAQAHIALVASKAFIRATIQPVVLQAIDVALHCAVGILALAPDRSPFAL